MINILSQDTINKIAAGEVVERPASVVKELVENAIDAGSNAITVEIKDGGISYIRITDNGCGILRDDIRKAFLSHTTSKISCIDDLANISSLGFRGEALSSIAAVTQLELITKTRNELTGVRYCIEGGEEKTFEEIGAPEGTTFIVRNLFFHTPVRKKFLKTPVSEAGIVCDLIERLSLSHPEVSFKFISNNKTLVQTTGNNNMKDVIYGIYGREIASQVLELNFEMDNIKVEGFIGKPYISRGNRNYEFVFVNGRYIKSNLISKAVEEAYKEYLMQHKYPFSVISISILKNDIDVNVHPTKMEVRFSEPSIVYETVYKAVSTALKKSLLIPEIKEINTEEKNVISDILPEPFEEKSRAEVLKHIEFDTPKKESFVQEKLDNNMVLEHVSEEPLYNKVIRNYRIVGQFFLTYWLVECDDNIYLIDQHAAHEKILYERMLRRRNNDSHPSQMISPPIIISLSLKEIETIEKYKNDIENMGYELEVFGGREYAVTAVPIDIYGLDSKSLIIEFIDMLSDECISGTPDSIYEKLASMSCKAAIKGNNRVSEIEARKLIEELMQLENPFNCPHGRPIIISMSKSEIEKKFKRIID